MQTKKMYPEKMVQKEKNKPRRAKKSSRIVEKHCNCNTFLKQKETTSSNQNNRNKWHDGQKARMLS